jgi:hypothetical protein
MPHFFMIPLTPRWDFQLCRAYRKDGGADSSFPSISCGSFRIGSLVLLAGWAPHGKGGAVVPAAFSTTVRFSHWRRRSSGRDEGSTTHSGAERVENKEDGGEDVEMPNRGGLYQYLTTSSAPGPFDGQCEPIARSVEVKVNPMDNPRAQSERPRRRDKAAWWMSTVARD